MLQVCEFLNTNIIPQERLAAIQGTATQAPTQEPPAKVLLFAHHRTVMDRLHMFLQGYDIAQREGGELRRVREAVGHVRIDGSTEHGLRATLQQQFRDDPECVVRFQAATTLLPPGISTFTR